MTSEISEKIQQNQDFKIICHATSTSYKSVSRSIDFMWIDTKADMLCALIENKSMIKLLHAIFC